MRQTVNEVCVVPIAPLSKAERKVVTKAVRRWLEKRVEERLLTPRIHAFDIALSSITLYDRSKQYEPKEVFETLYDKFGNELFTEYTGSFFDNPPPTPAQLNYPKFNPKLLPAAHYFTKSAALWEYGVMEFGLNARALDRYGNTALMAAVKRGEIPSAITMIKTAINRRERLKLIRHKNTRGSTALSIARRLPKHVQKHNEFQELMELLTKHYNPRK